MGVNDISKYGNNLGGTNDIDKDNWKNNNKTFAGYYSQIIQRLKEIQPKAKFFLMTIPYSPDSERKEAEDAHMRLLYDFSAIFDNTYILDFRKYAPQYDNEFKKNFYLGGHLSAAGYNLTARMVESYIDYIIRHNMEDFKQIAFVGTDFHNYSEKW